MTDFATLGYRVFDPDPGLAAWAAAALDAGRAVAADRALQAQWLRHGGTWFVGVDALPNAPDGSVQGAALTGPWQAHVRAPRRWHRAQLSVTYPRYPLQDGSESDANHRFRIRRCAAHVDGILLEEGRRYLREPHSFILGLPLNVCTACPLMVWPGSHARIGPALRAARAHSDDITEPYKAIRAACFEQITPVPVRARPGQAILLHRHMLHGIAPWQSGDVMPPEGRMVAYFRPELDTAAQW